MKTIILTLPIATLLILFGCSGGSETTEVKLPDGTNAKVTTNKDGSGISIEGNGVNAQVGGQLKVTQDDLHAPFYPGAIVDPNRSMTVKTATEESALVYMSSVDDISKVKEFYESKIPGIKFNEFKSGEQINIMGEAKADNGGKLAVTIMKKDSSSNVEITIGYGKEEKK
ncbi:MAG: hypothetical protein JNM34_09710 [Chthonomonadaceae bacterium]|nr:hypothetical protein [Chthonomonadaceae bacterium]